QMPLVAAAAPWAAPFATLRLEPFLRTEQGNARIDLSTISFSFPRYLREKKSGLRVSGQIAVRPPPSTPTTLPRFYRPSLWFLVEMALDHRLIPNAIETL